jgi:hypothetical protein
MMLIHLCDFLSYVDEDGFINEEISHCLDLQEQTEQEDEPNFWEELLSD